MICVEKNSDRMYENMQADSRIDFATHSVNIYEKIHFNIFILYLSEQPTNSYNFVLKKL